MPPRPPVRRWRPSRSSVASPVRATCKSTSSTAASAIPTSTWSGTNGAPRCFPWCRATRAAAGAAVDGYAVGDAVGVGCFVDSCRACPQCRAGQQQYCDEGMTATYNSHERSSGAPTYGGYSTRIVVDQDYVLRIPDGIPLDRAAPLLCAGVTTWSPLRHFGVVAGHRVAVMGLGGLGHMAVKLAVAMGAEVTVLSTSESK